MLLKSNLAVMISAVLVLTSPRQVVNVVTINCPMLALCPCEMAVTGMKYMVLVPGISSMPCAKWWISSVLVHCQSLLSVLLPNSV